MLFGMCTDKQDHPKVQVRVKIIRHCKTKYCSIDFYLLCLFYAHFTTSSVILLF